MSFPRDFINRALTRRSALKFSLAALFTTPALSKAFGATSVSTKVMRIGSTSFTINISSTSAGKAYV